MGLDKIAYDKLSSNWKYVRSSNNIVVHAPAYKGHVQILYL